MPAIKTDADFPPLKNDLIIRAAKGQYTERAPAWVMRQAGRYLPEFMEVRKSHSFFECCQTPELASELTLQPIRRYSGLLDAAIIFCDILVIPQAMGLTVEMIPGPSLPEPISVPADMERLSKNVDVDKELGYVYEAITMTREKLNGEVPLIGFVGAPWTLMSYMIEGGGTKTFQKCKTWLFKYPEAAHELLDRIAVVCADFLVGQVKAGAQLVQIFDSWAGELTPYHFKTFALPSLVKISKLFREKLTADGIIPPPLILFAKGANSSLASLAQTDAFEVLALDWCVTPGEAIRITEGKVALQGNADPMCLYGGRDGIEQEVKRVCEGFKDKGGKLKGYISNLGHGVTPAVDPEDMRWYLECVQKYSKSA
ncbi:uroporphyrinogen decarboxylase [Phaffia rhodozyma]|uniref:Uroporphyrinogen decarboxylase n=1 Tax=Phaffia rhodozyma TaxID=264483 RepID=A0A0F7ST90_PHARH|nr:uroporphyrinogen decarboxylase [Phaffia rhodozyma]